MEQKLDVLTAATRLRDLLVKHKQANIQTQVLGEYVCSISQQILRSEIEERDGNTLRLALILSATEGVMGMYEEYRDRVWDKVQRLSENIRQAIEDDGVNSAMDEDGDDTMWEDDDEDSSGIEEGGEMDIGESWVDTNIRSSMEQEEMALSSGHTNITSSMGQDQATEMVTALRDTNVSSLEQDEEMGALCDDANTSTMEQGEMAEANTITTMWEVSEESGLDTSYEDTQIHPSASFISSTNSVSLSREQSTIDGYQQGRESPSSDGSIHEHIQTTSPWPSNQMMTFTASPRSDKAAPRWTNVTRQCYRAS